MATFSDPYGIGTGVGSYYQGALAQDPRIAAINRNISGQIAPDVRNMLAQSAAERGIGIGSYGGGNDQSSLLRALGLTSMDLTNKGLGQYGEAHSQVPALRPDSLFVNPTDQAQMKLQGDLQSQRIASEESIASQNLNAAAGRQAGQLAAGAAEGSAGRAQQKSMFDKKREDAMSAAGRTDSALQSIIDRNSGGGTTSNVSSAPSSWGNWGPQDTSFAATADPSNLWWRPSDYEFGYTGPTSSPVQDFSNAWSDPYADTSWANQSPAVQPNANAFMYGLDEW